MTVSSLRPYQEDLVARIRAEYAAGHRAVMAMAPTGSGKTVMFSFITRAAAARGNRVCILVHRETLLLQASNALTDCRVAHGLIAPGHSHTGDPVQIASVQTMVRRLGRLTPPDLLVMDEAHHATAGSWARILAAYPTARVLGVSATPIRTDGHGLDHIFTALVRGPSVKELTAADYLVPAEVYAPATRPNLSGVHTRAGDYARDELAAAMDTPSITGDAVAHYRRHCPGARAVAFCVSVRHSEDTAAAFQAAGIASAVIHGGMPRHAIQAAIASLTAGRILVLASCDLISEGFDCPAIEAAILLRPTQSEALYIQQVGRALRHAPGKTKAIILDHSGNVFRHGMPDDDRDWTLAGRPRRARPTAPPVRQCPKCYACHRPAPACPQCGYVYQADDRVIATREGELEKVDADKIARRQALKRRIRAARTLEDFHAIAKDFNYKPAWASIKYQIVNRYRGA